MGKEIAGARLIGGPADGQLYGLWPGSREVRIIELQDYDLSRTDSLCVRLREFIYRPVDENADLSSGTADFSVHEIKEIPEMNGDERR